MFNALGPRDVNLYDDDEYPTEETLLGTRNETGVIKTYHAPEFRLSARYAIRENLSLKAGFNTMHQYIHKVSNTSIMSPTDIWKLSDLNIKPQNGWQAAAGIYHEIIMASTSAAWALRSRTWCCMAAPVVRAPSRSSW